MNINKKNNYRTKYNIIDKEFNLLLKKHKVIQVKNLLKKGLSPEKIALMMNDLTLDQINLIIEQYRPALRWALYHGHIEKKQDVFDILSSHEPDFDYLNKMYESLSKD